MLRIAREPVGIVKAIADFPNGIDDLLNHHLCTSDPNACTAAAMRVPPVIQHMMA